MESQACGKKIEFMYTLREKLALALKFEKPGSYVPNPSLAEVAAIFILITVVVLRLLPVPALLHLDRGNTVLKLYKVQCTCKVCTVQYSVTRVGLSEWMRKSSIIYRYIHNLT